MENYDLQVLNVEQIKLFVHGGVLRLTVADDRSYCLVRGYRAFPISDPDHYYGVTDGAGKDIGVIVNPAHLDDASRHAIQDELEKRYFVPVVIDVIGIKEEYGSILWDVETDRGTKRYVVRSLRDNLVELPDRRLLITDIEGNRFEVSDLRSLDSKSQEVLLKSM